jgi:hypothetical protein
MASDSVPAAFRTGVPERWLCFMDCIAWTRMLVDAMLCALPHLRGTKTSNFGRSFRPYDAWTRTLI